MKNKKPTNDMATSPAAIGAFCSAVGASNAPRRATIAASCGSHVSGALVITAAVYGWLVEVEAEAAAAGKGWLASAEAGAEAGTEAGGEAGLR